MARFDIISKDGNTIRYSGKPRYSGSYLKPSFLEFSEISSPTPIAWEVGDYVDYPRTGMRYRLYSIPQPSKNARKGSYGGAFSYSNVQLHAATKELEIALFRDLVANDNNIHFSTSPDVATYENVEGIARRIQACMDDLYPGRWEIRMAEFDATADAEVIEKIATAKDFALSGGTCLDALSKIYELWEEVGWIHTHENGKEVITIGYANKRIGANTTDVYLYGKGNGLTAIKKNQTNKDEFATRLYVYGSERNLPHRYYNEKDILNAESVDIRNLMLPLDKWGLTDGLPDARKAYLENAEAVAKYGVIPKTHYFDSDDAGADIYPSIEGMTVGQLRKVLADMGETKYSPNVSIYPNDSERVDEIFAAPRMVDDGVLKRNGKEHDIENGWYLFAATTPGTTIPKGTAEKTAVVENHLIKDLDIDSQGIIRAKITFTSDKICTLADAGYKSVSGVLTLANSLDSPSIEEEMGFTFVLNDDGVWEGRLPKVIANYDKQSYVRYVAFATMSVYVTPKKALASDVTASVNISDGYVTFIADQLFDKTFQLTLKQIGFDINERAAMGEGKVISMKTGMCAGRNFVISECRYVESTDKWSLVCRRQQDDTLGMLFPNKDYQIAMGDQFVLLDIALPEVYIGMAQERLLAEGERLLAKASRIQNHYEPMIDAKVMMESGRTLREGMYMEISDEDVIDNGTDYILIDTLSIYEDESAIPTYKVTLREKRKVTYKGTPSATSETSTKSYGEEQTADVDIDLSDYATKSYVGNEVEAVKTDIKAMPSTYVPLKTINGLSLYGSGNINVEGGVGAVDSAMSDTSENAVQNKVIKKYVDDAAVYLEGYVEEQVNALEASVNQTFGDVETSIEQLDGAVSELFASKAGAFYVEPSTNLFIVFTTEEKKAAYIANGDTSGMLGKFALGGGGGTSQTYYDMAVVGLEKNYNYTTTSEKMIISAGFESRIMKAGSSTYEPYEEDAVFSVDILKGGAWKPVMSQMVSNGSTFSADLKPYVANGDNIIRVTATGLISSASGVASATLSVTTMSLAPFGFQWYTPFVEGQSYELGGLKILGTLNKRLHIKVTGNGYSKEYVESIGTQQYDIAPYSFRNLVHPSATGIYKVEMWLEAVASGVKSDTLTYNIMCVAQSAVGTAKLVCLNEVATEADNYAESKLFAYAIYNGGSASGSPTITLKKGSTTIASSSLNVDAGVPHDYSYAFALAMTETSANITATATFGNTQTATIALKNETSFAPVGGYSFYMDAATRSNGEAYRNYIVNEANGSRILASWTDMAWVDGMDGWTTDKDGNKCLLLPAMSKAYVDYAPMANKNTMTLELFYKVQNAADFDEDIITIASNVASSWMGVKVKPTNVTLHSQSLYQNDLMQGYNTKDEEMVHLVITIIGNYDGIGSIAMIYVNGGKRCSFEWSTGDTFAHNGTLVLGSDTADLYVYKMRVYDSQFLWPQVLQNYISCQHTAAERSQIKRREDSVLNDSNGLDYDKIVGKQNTFVIELPKGAQLPNRLNNPSNDPIEGCNIYIDIVQDRQCSVQGHWLLVPIDGQGTTGMTYFRWNLRSKTATIRITAKKDVASSSHSHKRGGTGLYNDLYQRIVGHNEVNGRMAVYQYPVYGYLKVENEDAPGTYHYEFIGLYTIGPDKGDKSTFGFDNAEYKDTLIHMEGTDHSPAGVGYDYPWEQMTVGLNEKGDAFLGAKNTSGGLAQEAWEIGACGGKKTASDIKTYLDAEYAPAYKLDYECTPMISGLASGQTIYSVNTDVTNFRKQTSYENFTKADCIIFDADYNTYYYNVNSQSYVADGRKVYDGLTSSHGFSLSTLNSKGSVSAKEQYIRECRAKRHRAEVGNYWLLRDSLFHACFLDLIGATDNEKKNTYPLKFGTLASGSRWRHRQDDLDTMADINNQGSADKKYSIMNTDSKDGVMVYKGNSSYHWRCIREYYKDDMKSMMREIFDNMKSLSPYGISDIQKLVGCIRHYFWDYAQEYFTRGAYNIDAKWTYEDTWRLYKSDKTINAVHPLQQSLGSHYEAEVAWMTLRMLFLASMNEWGAFVHYSDSSEGQVSFRQGRDFTFKLTPAIDMRPSVVIGSDSDKKFANGRVMAGNTASILVAASGDGDTMAYIQGADWLQDIGDFSTLKLGSTSRSLAVTSKRLQKLKVGDATASKVTTNITGLDLGSCPSLAEIDARNVTALAGEVDLTNCPRLRIARFGGTSASVIKLPDGSKIETFDLPSSLMRLTLRKLPLLRKSGLTYDALNNLTYLWVQDNKNLDGYDMLKSAWEGNSPLKNIRVIGFTKTADDDDTTFLLGLAEGEHYGIDEQGNVNDNINPVVQGTLNYDVIDGEAYDALKASYGDVLVINYNKIIAFIKFADSDVLAKLLANGIGSDGGVTKAQAAAVTTLPSFYNDQAIDSFDELQYFTSVTQIGPSGSTNGGFLKAINLKSIVLPPSVKTIGFAAFQETAISSINLDNVTKFLERAFQLCSNLGIVNAPSLEDIGATAFASSGITEIVSLGKVTTLKSSNSSKGTFAGCKKLVKANLTGITVFGLYEFNQCTSLAEVIIDWSKVTSIGQNTFNNCTQLVIDNLNLSNLESFGQNAFYGVKVKSITSMGGLTSLPAATGGQQNYGSNAYLEYCCLPDGVANIPQRSFQGYSVLRTLVIGSGCTSIEGYIVNNCKSLATIVCKATTPPALDSNAWYGATAISSYYVPDASVDAYKAATNWSNVASMIKPLSEYNG